MLTKHEKEVLSNIVRRENKGCEMCGKDVPLQPHRIVRGYMGGIYLPRNIQCLCPDCHRLFHHREEGIRKR